MALSGWWEERVLPHLTERSLSSPPVRRLRAECTRGLSGSVLEIGFGSGANLPFYPEDVERVAAVEPSATAWRLSERRRVESPVFVERVGLDGQRLPLPDGTYDAALSTFTLCTIPDPAAALREVRRVLRPGGTLHFLEHGVAPTDGVRRWQRRLEPWQRRAAGGCHLTRDLPALLAEAGLRVVELETGYPLGGPAAARPWTHLFWGRAVAP